MFASQGRGPFSFAIIKSLAIAFSAAAAVCAQHSSTITLPDSIMAPGTTTTWLKKVPRYCEGPATDGNIVYFTEQRASNDLSWPIWKIDLSNPSDTGKRLVTESNQSNGLFVDDQHRVLAAQKGKIVRYTAAGVLDTTFVTSPANGISFNQANDLSLGKNGAIYFTDLGGSVFYLSPSRQLKTVVTGLSMANGVEWIEEESAVYVNQVGGNKITRYKVGAEGALTLDKQFATITQPDGADLDIHGNWYVGSYGEGAVHVFNAAGQDIGKIVFNMEAGQYNASSGQQGNICNCHFGGAENKTLYCTGDGGLFSIKLKIPGRVWPAASTTGLGAVSRAISPLPEQTGAYRPDGRFWNEGFDKKAAGAAKPMLPKVNARAH